MASLPFVLLLPLLFFLAPSASARLIQLSSTSTTENQIASRRILLHDVTAASAAHFMSHPLWVGATISFSAGFFLGTIFYTIYRIFGTCNLRTFIKNRLHPEPAYAPTIFTPLLLSPDNLSFVDDLCHGHLPAPLQVIGRGGCGEVYRADLISTDRTVPVAIKKVVYPPSLGVTQLFAEESNFVDHRMRQIRSEIKTVGRMRHPNLVRLLAHVPQPGSHYLIYEYMPHGSLHDVLIHGSPELDWSRRYKIALGIAAGLEYLHMTHRPKVIHRDLKPGNILLDKDLNARIGDFGLAKLVQLDTVSGAISSNHVAGTLGYIAPEYYQTLSCTEKCDIYSFGVLLLVLVTGKFPSNEFFQMTDEMCIVGWVRAVMQSDNPMVVIDPKLFGRGFEEKILLVTKIACFCTYDDPNERPNSRDLRYMLAQIGL
ncbi:Leucine-rich receptor-like protein kinase family protein [Rhynchospora pubera]|uniref:Leucine-rich receptor-like protein kinase family protein n=1 Tax=Rhynchospora pubera TaxID=906938 RepID=A0AAV8HEZ4_9POAL|nr:Leucine-rich receptor-like protein kinase family protein [Rhynchospora pubera]